MMPGHLAGNIVIFRFSQGLCLKGAGISSLYAPTQEHAHIYKLLPTEIFKNLITTMTERKSLEPNNNKTNK